MEEEIDQRIRKTKSLTDQPHHLQGPNKRSKSRAVTVTKAMSICSWDSNHNNHSRSLSSSHTVSGEDWKLNQHRETHSIHFPHKHSFGDKERQSEARENFVSQQITPSTQSSLRTSRSSSLMRPQQSLDDHSTPTSHFRPSQTRSTREECE
jgi:hypothetical protein